MALRLALLAVWLALPGCTLPLLVPEPCDRIVELPAVAAEMDSMAALERSMGRPYWRAVREYAVEADADCAAARVLRQEALSQAESPPWWRRALGWMRRIVS
jgi:hypothetical protein